ncbi:GAP family protein [Streptomyces sp. NPDC055013]
MGSPRVVDLLLIALAITLDPLPLMAFVLVVASGRGVRTGLAFIAGRMACFVAVIALVLTPTGGQPPRPGRLRPRRTSRPNSSSGCR